MVPLDQENGLEAGRGGKVKESIYKKQKQAASKAKYF